MNKQLDELLKQKKIECAEIIATTAQYYTPFGRLPNIHDYTCMQAHMAELSKPDVKLVQYWPEASDRLKELVNHQIKKYGETKSAVEALETAGAKTTISDESLFEAAMKTNPMLRRMTQQLAAVA